MPADTTLETAIATIANLEEAIADLQQLALEDRGWDRLLAGAQDDLTDEGRRRIGDMCNVMTIANPLIKRGFRLRLAYVWGAGCEQAVKPGEKMVERLILARPHIGGNSLVPFVGIGEFGIDVENDAAKREVPMPDLLADRELRGPDFVFNHVCRAPTWTAAEYRRPIRAHIRQPRTPSPERPTRDNQ